MSLSSSGGLSSSTSSSFSTPASLQSNLDQQTLLSNLSSYWQRLESNVFNHAQHAYNGLVDLTDPVIGNQIYNSAMMSQAGQGQLNQYQNTFRPQENMLAQQSNTYNSQARQQAEMGAAQMRAQQANQQARNNSMAQLQSMGINPSSGRYAALDQASNLQGAATATAAANQARQNTQNTGMQLNQAAVNTGLQMPNQVANYLNTGIQAGNSAANIATARTGLGSNMLNQPAQVAAGLMGNFNYAPVGQRSESSSSSHSINSSNSMDMAQGGPIHDWRVGGHVPTDASPSQGQTTDDVDARLNAGEYVIPRDVSSHLGSKFFDNLIKKSRSVRGAPQQPIGPTYQRAA